MNNNPLTRTTGASCLAYAPIESALINYKYFWKDLPCDTKASFICRHNSDFLGYHKLTHLVLEKSVDVMLPSMTATVCLGICKVQSDATHVAVILESRCICAKGNFNFVIE